MGRWEVHEGKCLDQDDNGHDDDDDDDDDHNDDDDCSLGPLKHNRLK